MNQTPSSGDRNGDVPDVNPYAVTEQQGQQRRVVPGKLKTYLAESLLCLFCCGGFLAIPAIIYALQVDTLVQMGDYEAAVRASENAKRWCIIAVSVSAVCAIAGFALNAGFLAVGNGAL